MSPPVRIKVYGLSLTRRGYFAWVGLGVVLFVTLASVWLVLFAHRPPTPAEQAGEWPVAAIGGFLRYGVPGCLLLGIVLQGIELYFVLKRFRRAEAEQARAAGSPQPPSDKES